MSCRTGTQEILDFKQHKGEKPLTAKIPCPYGMVVSGLSKAA